MNINEVNAITHEPLCVLRKRIFIIVLCIEHRIIDTKPMGNYYIIIISSHFLLK